MDLRDFFSCKRTGTSELDSATDQEPSGDANSLSSLTQATCVKKQHLTTTERRNIYKSKLSFKMEWENKYPWVTCTDPSECMFCGTCEKWGNPPAGSAGAWTTRGVTDWNHGTELLKHAHSQ